MELIPLIVLALLAIAGAGAGVAVALRSGRPPTPTAGPAKNQEQGLLRVTGEVHTGWEQTLIALIRELPLPRGVNEAGYGALYLEAQTEHRMYVRTRSEIGRGFLGALEITPRRGPTHVTYAILRLPSDEQLHTRVLDFELDLVSALRRVDPNVNVYLAGNALREIDRIRPAS